MAIEDDILALKKLVATAEGQKSLRDYLPDNREVSARMRGFNEVPNKSAPLYTNHAGVTSAQPPEGPFTRPDKGAFTTPAAGGSERAQLPGSARADILRPSDAITQPNPALRGQIAEAAQANHGALQDRLSLTQGPQQSAGPRPDSLRAEVLRSPAPQAAPQVAPQGAPQVGGDPNVRQQYAAGTEANRAAMQERLAATQGPQPGAAPNAGGVRDELLGRRPAAAAPGATSSGGLWDAARRAGAAIEQNMKAFTPNLNPNGVVGRALGSAADVAKNATIGLAKRATPYIAPAMEAYDVAQVAMDPNSSKADVAEQAGIGAARTGGAIAGAGTGAAIGSAILPGVGTVLGGIGGGIGGYVGMDKTISAMREALGLPRLSPAERTDARSKIEKRMTAEIAGNQSPAELARLNRQNDSPSAYAGAPLPEQASPPAAQSQVPATQPVGAGLERMAQDALAAEREADQFGVASHGWRIDNRGEQVLSYTMKDGRVVSPPGKFTIGDAKLLEQVDVLPGRGPVSSRFQENGRTYTNTLMGVDENGMPIIKAYAVLDKNLDGKYIAPELIRKVEAAKERQLGLAPDDDAAIQRYQGRIDRENGRGSPTPGTPAPGSRSLSAELDGNRKIVADAATAAGYDPALALMKVGIESNFKADAKNPQSTALGLGQLLKANREQYGLTDEQWKDPAVATPAIIDFMKRTDADLTQRIGRAPSPRESYMGHLFGPTGAATILAANPDAKLRDVVATYEPKLADKIVTANRFDNMTVGQALAALDKKVAQHLPQGSAAVAPASPIAQQAYAQAGAPVSFPGAEGDPQNWRVLFTPRGMLIDGVQVPTNVIAGGWKTVDAYLDKLAKGQQDKADPTSAQVAIEKEKKAPPAYIKLEGEDRIDALTGARSKSPDRIFRTADEAIIHQLPENTALAKPANVSDAELLANARRIAKATPEKIPALQAQLQAWGIKFIPDAQ